MSKYKNKIKKIKQVKQIKWLDAPEEHDYPACLSYLLLLYSENVAMNIVEELKDAPIVSFKSKDIFRASSLSLLGISNSHVKKNRDKIKKGVPLSPLLLITNSDVSKVIIGDGYHRLCSVYGYNEDALIPCKIVSVE